MELPTGDCGSGGEVVGAVGAWAGDGGETKGGGGGGGWQVERRKRRGALSSGGKQSVG